MQRQHIAKVSWIFILLFFLSRYVSGIIDSTRVYRVTLNASFILARNFSNYPLRPAEDDVSRTTYKATASDQKYRPGFELGADLIFLPQKATNVFLGISVSKTNAEYHSSFLSIGPTSRGGFTDLQRVTENDYKLAFTSLNFQAGLRRQLLKSFFLSASALLNSPLRVERELNGYTETTYSNNSGATDRDVIYISNERTVLKQKAADLSLRLTGSYAFKLVKRNTGVYIFRNFGLLYALPWWGAGVSFSVYN